MRSVRLTDEIEVRVRRAARIEGVTVSEFIRRAASRRADETLGTDAADRLADVIGAIDGRDDQARQTGEAFSEALIEKRRRRG